MPETSVAILQFSSLFFLRRHLQGQTDFSSLVEEDLQVKIIKLWGNVTSPGGQQSPDQGNAAEAV